MDKKIILAKIKLSIEKAKSVNEASIIHAKSHPFPP